MKISKYEFIWFGKLLLNIRYCITLAKWKITGHGDKKYKKD